MTQVTTFYPIVYFLSTFYSPHNIWDEIIIYLSASQLTPQYLCKSPQGNWSDFLKMPNMIRQCPCLNLNTLWFFLGNNPKYLMLYKIQYAYMFLTYWTAAPCPLHIFSPLFKFSTPYLNYCAHPLTHLFFIAINVIWGSHYFTPSLGWTLLFYTFPAYCTFPSLTFAQVNYLHNFCWLFYYQALRLMSRGLGLFCTSLYT